MKRTLIFLTAMLLLGVRPAMASIVSTFDGTDLDGWIVEPGDGFSVDNPGSGGNTGAPPADGYLRVTDTRDLSEDGYLVAPEKYQTDLTGYRSISWDALLPDNWGFFTATQTGLVTLEISNGSTTWTYDLGDPIASGQADQWQQWEAPFDQSDSNWMTDGGPDSLADVLSDVTRLAFFVEVTNTVGLEAGLDNVELNPIPVPAAVWLFGSGLLGLVGIARRRRHR